MDPGEFFDVALIREFKEETNLDVNIESLFEVVQDEFISRRTNQPISTVQLMMNLEIMDGEVQISSEHDEYKWVSIEELKELYDNIDIPHITLSISEDGKAVNTQMLDFMPTNEFKITTKFGGFLGKPIYKE